MLLIMLTWGLLAAGFAGVGSLFHRAFGLRLHRPEDWFLAFWAGFAFVLVVVQIWNLFWPIDDLLRGLLALLALGGLAWNSRDLLPLLKKARCYALFGLYALLFTLWLANRSIGEPVVYEVGLYHINVMQWAQAYPIVPGLGNLHSRLGFSTTYFLYPALLDAGPWAGRTYHIANSLLFWVLFIQMSWSGRLVLRARRFDFYHNFQFLLVPVIWLLLPSETLLPSIANDPPILALGLVIAAQGLQVISRPGMGGRQALYRLFLIVLISGIGTAIKYSFLIYGAALSLLIFGLWLVRYGAWRPALALRLLVFCAGVAALSLLPMMARSVIATGYPLYPITLAPFPVDWRIYEAHAQLEYDFIRVFSRSRAMHPHYMPENWNWFPRWLYERLNPTLLRDYFYFGLPFVLALGTAALLAVRYMFRYSLHPPRPSPQVTGPHWWFLLPALLGVGFWFYSAPDPRFAGASLWVLALALLVYAMYELGWGRGWHRYALLLLMLGLCAAPFAFNNRLDLLTRPGSRIGFTAMPKPFIKTFETDHDLAVLFPTENNQCWDAPLPCTPYPHPNLRLRLPGDLSQGFILTLREGDRPQVID